MLLVCVPQAAINSLAVIVIVMIISELLLSASEQVTPLYQSASLNPPRGALYLIFIVL